MGTIKKIWGIFALLLLTQCAFPKKYSNEPDTMYETYKQIGLNCKVSTVILNNRTDQVQSLTIDGIITSVEPKSKTKFKVLVKYNDKKRCIESSNVIQTYTSGIKGQGTFRFRPCAKTTFNFE